MKSLSPSSPSPSSGWHQDVPLTPTYTTPRAAPKPPPAPDYLKPPSFKTSFQNIFRKPSRPPSIHSAYSTSTSTSASSDKQPIHNFTTTMHGAPLPVVSSHDSPDDEDECPVCLEPLSFSFRLPGEKPHIVPECGHALHEVSFSLFIFVCLVFWLNLSSSPSSKACFTAVYGPLPNQARSSTPRKLNLGVCGVCRRPMKVGDGDGGKSNKLAALTGMADHKSTNPLFPGRETPTIRKGTNTPHPHDPHEDDPIDHVALSRSPAGEHSPYIIAPSIQLRSEFPSLTRTNDPSQPLTCIVIIELPGKRPTGNVPGPAPNPVLQDTYLMRTVNQNRHNATPSTQYSPHFDHVPTPRGLSSADEYPGSSRPVNDHNNYSAQISAEHDSPYTPSSNLILREEDSPFAAITEDLHNRIIDWKGHPLSDLGPLQMYDLLSVRRDTAIREFYVYLFKEAIICAIEEKKRGLGRLLSNASNFTDPGSIGSHSSNSKGVLRLKGRIYVRHIRNVTATSAAGEMSLTIDMEDELASFILVFKDRSSLEAWKNTIQALVNMFRGQKASPKPPEPHMSLEEFGGNSKAMRMLSGGSTMTTVSTVDSLLNGSSSRSTASSSTSHGSMMYSQKHLQIPHQKLTPLGEDDELSTYEQPSSLVTPYTSAGPSNSLTPLPHPPMDLIMVVSIPPPTAVPSTAQLKVRVLKATLDFTLNSLGPRDRLSFVTYEVGTGGKIRKTPFLCTGKAQSRARLAKFIDELGMRLEENQDEFLVRGSKDEHTDVVNAVNHGLDVVLQRKGRNPIGGMVLVSDTSDHTRRAQLDLVLARAEAANMPIHSFGYGRSHEPSSIWLMSSSTKGTYTYVKDWYDLRECVAGCVGGMMSIGLLHMRLHMRIVDGNRFRIRKVSGGPSAIVASDGQNVDVDVGELRYGERKEMLIELELDNSDAYRAVQQHHHHHQQWSQGNVSQASGATGARRALNATDQFVQSLGLGSLAIDDGVDFAFGMMDRMIDEVPVVEVDGSFFDPSAGKHVSRLAHPVLLTVTLLPMTLGPGGSQQRPPSHTSDPVIVRRRMELLASEMISRALVLVTKGNFQQGRVIFGETKRILYTVLQTISQSLPPPNANGSTVRNRKELLTLAAVRAMQSILQDLQLLAEALEENVELFSHDHRKFGAQQAMILREQKSWTGRSATERLFWSSDNSIELVSRSADWIVRE
ncbi:hypothetical protein AMATHDRAFT_4171 [Amanita thiersii Skay4041]|uniref:Uncharacterized protein n=1 Tax=Amanita thiersii Skay4041 TaxID=703135 RepID=A0A2A9NPU0_9AGAR|nr:hypothetical protein AMATHDRAFT_4171 [Amanita thiersii Skay4041]